ncbi:CBS domain-containing protein [Candidatus Pacearchaeota archaeon]|nr:CBS domain-containing protein [Candidatus Pacearchaeota archaeon]
MGKINIMKAEVCSGDKCVKDVAKEMSSKKIRRFYIVNGKKELEGVFTTVDLIKVIVGDKDASKVKVKDIMTKNVKYIDLESSIEDALKIMNDLRTFVCPVVDNGKFIGIVGYQDIIRGVVDESRK